MLIHPLLKLAASQPHLLGDHLEAYAALAGEEMKKVSSGWALRIGMFAGAGVLALVGLIWVGVALLIAAAVPSDDYRAGWALWVVPLAPFVIAAMLVLVARAKKMVRPFEVLSQQFQADLAVVREASAP